MTIVRGQLEFVRSPKQFATNLTTDPKAVEIGFRNVLAVAILYEGAILLWALGADGVTLRAFLRIPEKQYYLYGLVFLIPDYIQGILWTSGWVPFREYQELTGSGVLHAIVWAYVLAYTLCHLILYAITIRQTQILSTTRSAVVALVAFLGSFAVWITFAR